MADLFSGASAQITPFSFNAHAVRAFADAAGNPWFCANDVCAVLGYKNPRMSVERHCKAEGVLKRDTPTESGTQEMTFINEGNLYRLIVKSRKPEAVEFERTVMDEILPAIRKTGKYEAKPEAVPSLSNRRWLISYDHTGREQAQAVPFDAFVMNFAEFAKAIVEPGGMMPSNVELANLAAACNTRLAQRMEYAASKKAVTV